MGTITKQQVPVLVARFVEFQEEFAVNGLPSEDGQWAIQDTKAAIRLCVEAIKNRNSGRDFYEFYLLEHHKTIIIPAQREKFIAKEKFSVNTSDGAEVKIYHIGDNFTKWFFKKIEEPSSLDSAIDLSKLLKLSVNRLIIEKLDGEGKAPITLKELYFLMRFGNLDQHGSYVSYILDDLGILRAVSVRRNRYGWAIDAESIEDPEGWLAGNRVVSRNFSQWRFKTIL